jgi:gamma-glutamylcyclotransferase (GGCT)/AIG2-like uncharacterized protein YtfP
MPELLFVYGTLKNPNIQQKIVGRKLVGAPAILENCTILNDGVYPVLVEEKNKNVEGIVLDVFSADFSALDKYEGNDYKRVKVQLKDGKEVWIYKNNDGK